MERSTAGAVHRISRGRLGRPRQGSALRRLALAATVAACVSAPAGQDDPPVSDPLEPVNRKVLVFNYVADTAVLRPAAGVYERVVPRFLRNRVRRFIDNLDEPRTALNQLLQGRPGAAASDAARFIVNTTVGLGGLFDPAAAAGLERHREDFGQTLGRWGVPSGPYLVLPVIGSSTLRDGAAKLVDAVTSPTMLLERRSVRVGIGAVDRVDARSRQPAAGDMGEDPYAYLRAAHMRERRADVLDPDAGSAGHLPQPSVDPLQSPVSTSSSYVPVVEEPKPRTSTK